MISVIGIVTICIALIIYYLGNIYFQKQPPSIPGLDAASKDLGNLGNIKDAGSLHEFLLDLHSKYGDMASFWFGSTQMISVSSSDLFAKVQILFNRPPILFKMFEPFIGPKSLQYANFNDGKNRRRDYDRSMSHKAICRYIEEFQQAAEETIESLGDKVGAVSHNFSTEMAEFALKVSLGTMFGNASNKIEIMEFYNNYQLCWEEMENRLAGEFPDPSSVRQKNFDVALEGAKSFIKKVVKIREDMEITEDNERLIDILIRTCEDEETLLSDSITYVTGGFHTTANSLVWAFYFIAKDKAVQQKIHTEIDQYILTDKVDIDSISKCTYLRQVFDETLRCSVLAPFAARFSDEDIELQGCVVPAGTPIVLALGVSLQDPVLNTDPTKFDPERFNPENSKDRPTLAYQPFGTGKRICPGHRFAIIEAMVCLIKILKRYEISLVGCEDVTRVHGLVTHPSEEIMISLAQRD